MSRTSIRTRSLRLNFSLGDDGIALISTIRVKIKPPPGDTLEEKSGFSINLTDQSGEVFYSRMIRNPEDESAESFGESENDLIIIETLEKPDKEFSMLIPDPGQVFITEIVNMPFSNDKEGAPEKKVFSFTINPDEEIVPQAAAIESIEDGRVIGAEKIVDHGNDEDCWNMAIVAEGYRLEELDKFKTDTDNFINFGAEVAKE